MIGVCAQVKREVGPPPPRNKIVDRTFINIMLEYSARKNNANGPPAYSTLNPETSSDSPSVRSKGVRLVSARVDTYHIIPIGVAVRINHEKSWLSTIVTRLNLPERATTHKTIRPSLTS